MFQTLSAISFIVAFDSFLFWLGTVWHLAVILWHLPGNMQHVPGTLWQLPGINWHLLGIMCHLPFTMSTLYGTMFHLPRTMWPDNGISKKLYTILKCEYFFYTKKHVNSLRSCDKNSVNIFSSCDKYVNRATNLLHTSIFQPIYSSQYKKMPHTGETESLDRCGS